MAPKVGSQPGGPCLRGRKDEEIRSQAGKPLAGGSRLLKQSHYIGTFRDHRSTGTWAEDSTGERMEAMPGERVGSGQEFREGSAPAVAQAARLRVFGPRLR